MTPTEQNRAARQEWLRKGGEDFAARCRHGLGGVGSIGADGTFINPRIESAYLGSMTTKEPIRFTANASRQQFLDAIYPGAANGTTVEGAFLSTTIEAEYQAWLAGQALMAYQINIEARQRYYDSLGHAIHRDVVNTTCVMFMTNTAGQFIVSTTEACFLAWQARQAVAAMLDENQIAEPESEFTQADTDALHALRSRGFAVVVFTPSELENMDEHASIDALESRMISVGNDYIDEHEKED